MCDCEFDPYDDSDEESWHFKRTCASCGHVWYGLHCPHDGYQNPCPRCGVRPTPEEERAMSDEMTQCVHGRFAMGMCPDCARRSAPLRVIGDEEKPTITFAKRDYRSTQHRAFVLEGMGVAFPHANVVEGSTHSGVDAEGREISDIVCHVADALFGAWIKQGGR